VALYSARVGGGWGVPLPRDGSSALEAEAEAEAEGSDGLMIWHSFVLIFSYNMRPSGSCVVFHRGFRPPATDSATAVVPSLAGGGDDAPGAVNRAELSAVVRGRRNPVIIIIATEAVAQFTIGEPAQKLVDMLPLTSSAILMRLLVGVMFWKASLNALSRAAMI